MCRQAFFFSNRRVRILTFLIWAIPVRRQPEIILLVHGLLDVRPYPSRHVRWRHHVLERSFYRTKIGFIKPKPSDKKSSTSSRDCGRGPHWTNAKETIIRDPTGSNSVSRNGHSRNSLYVVYNSTIIAGYKRIRKINERQRRCYG